MHMNPGDHEKKYCSKCGYDLEGLTIFRCPECAQPFNPADARTFSRTPLPQRGRVWLLVAYAIPALLNGLFWAWFVSAHGSYFGIQGALPVLNASLLSGCGPLLLVLMLVPGCGLGTVSVVSGLWWAAWIGFMWIAGAHRLPMWLHVAFGCVWWLIGSVFAGVSV